MPPTYTTSGLCGDRMNGVFQFQRISVPASGVGTMFVFGLFRDGARGRMLPLRPVVRLVRRTFPFCDSR